MPAKAQFWGQSGDSYQGYKALSQKEFVGLNSSLWHVAGLPVELEAQTTITAQEIISGHQLNELINEIKELKDMIGQLSELVDSFCSEKNNGMEIRNISFGEAKKEIVQYFKEHHGEHLTAADLEEVLGIDFWLCEKICEKLTKEGKIK